MKQDTNETLNNLVDELRFYRGHGWVKEVVHRLARVNVTENPAYISLVMHDRIRTGARKELILKVANQILRENKILFEEVEARLDEVIS